jgi:hypothetical protein
MQHWTLSASGMSEIEIVDAAGSGVWMPHPSMRCGGPVPPSHHRGRRIRWSVAGVVLRCLGVTGERVTNRLNRHLDIGKSLTVARIHEGDTGGGLFSAARSI